MKRVYIQKIEGKKHFLSAENQRYLKKTLRFKGGEELLVFDGEQEVRGVFYNDYIELGKVVRIKENAILRLGIAEIQKERLEWLVEKATELGVSEITVLKTERSQKFYSFERLARIAVEASKQCLRVSIPEIKQAKLSDFIAKIDQKEWVFASLKTQNKQFFEEINGVLIGPEGGWTEEEELLLSSRLTSVLLNGNVLRSETAAIVALGKIRV